jgi:hypothetical protein
MVPTFLYTTAASGGSPTADELAAPDPARAEAERALAENALGGFVVPPELGPLPERSIEGPPVLLFHRPIKAD